jgi:signal transduction histidine kinase
MEDRRSWLLLTELVEAQKVRVSLPLILHKINNSWQGVTAALRTLQRQSADKPIDRELLSEICLETEKAASFAKTFSNRLKTKPNYTASINLSRLVSDVVGFVGPRYEHEPKIDESIEADVFISGNQLLLFQMLVYLIDNAVESNSDQISRIHIDLSTSQSMDECVACLVVSDQGCGMDEDFSRTCVEPFIAGVPGNVGLGLTAVSRIVERHSGQLKIDSKLGEGTKVTCIFPCGGSQPS